KEAALRDRHRLIGAAVENIDAVAGDIGEQLEGVAGRVAAEEQSFDIARSFHRRHAAAVRPVADPAGAGADGGELIRARDADVPRAMAAHGVAGEIHPLRIEMVTLAGIGHRFEYIFARPGFPIETVRPAALRGEDVRPAFRTDLFDVLVARHADAVQ